MNQDELAAREELGLVSTAEEVFGARAEKFNHLVADYVSIKGLIKTSEEEIRVLQKQIEQYLADAPSKTVMSDGLRVTTVVNQGRETIDRLKLLEAGVAAETIRKCTVQGQPFSYVKVTAPKEKRQ